MNSLHQGFRKLSSNRLHRIDQNYEPCRFACGQKLK